MLSGTVRVMHSTLLLIVIFTKIFSHSLSPFSYIFIFLLPIILFSIFVFLVYLVIFFVYRDLHDVGAKKISVFALNKVSEPSFVARNLIIIILYSSVMVKSVAREMGGSRKE